MPASVTATASLSFLNGALKYGRNNWRAKGVSASIYVSAAKRHIDAWFEGEELDGEGVPHLGAAIACVGIIIDAKAAGKLTDDRQMEAGYSALAKELTALIAPLQALHAEKNPHHYTVADNEIMPAADVSAQDIPHWNTAQYNEAWLAKQIKLDDKIRDKAV